MLYFNVFGQMMGVLRRDEEWCLYHCSERGLRLPIFDVIIPSELGEDELGDFLGKAYAHLAKCGQRRVVAVS
ncbi:DUF7661 family protein [Dongshaea marina]|uniref:DUF7661 family protein n=1 Tax=Dongshaea marina TaxID=2047966 RepID=UPI000D3EB8D2|nr:hypothetical protein [Dongshaea marina]